MRVPVTSITQETHPSTHNTSASSPRQITFRSPTSPDMRNQHKYGWFQIKWLFQSFAFIDENALSKDLLWQCLLYDHHLVYLTSYTWMRQRWSIVWAGWVMSPCWRLWQPLHIPGHSSRSYFTRTRRWLDSSIPKSYRRWRVCWDQIQKI